MAGVCGDNRFEIIAKVKEHLIKATNIEMHPEELAQVDNILFRLWQCGYLKDTKELQEENKRICGKFRTRVADLEKQIEKMKCCFNCKHSRTVYEHCRTNKHEKWEIKENE